MLELVTIPSGQEYLREKGSKQCLPVGKEINNLTLRQFLSMKDCSFF